MAGNASARAPAFAGYDFDTRADRYGRNLDEAGQQARAGPRGREGQKGRKSGAGSGFSPLPVMESTITCSVRLQMLMYFSGWYDVLYFVVHVVAGWIKWRYIFGYVVWALFAGNFFLCLFLEPIRLYLGYTGNLGERVPEFFSFVAMCTFCWAILATELALYYGTRELKPQHCSVIPGVECILSVEKACWMVKLALLLSELILAVQALQHLIHEKSARFFISLEPGTEERVPASMLGREATEVMYRPRGAIANGPVTDTRAQQAAGASAAWDSRGSGTEMVSFAGSEFGRASRGNNAAAPQLMGRPAPLPPPANPPPSFRSGYNSRAHQD